MIEFMMGQAELAHWYAFGLLWLTGCYIPISEDLVIIGSGVIAAAVAPQNVSKLLLLSYLGALMADITNYWLARLMGPGILRLRFVSAMINPEKIEKTREFLDRYGSAALLFVRFIPFGVRIALYTTAGMSKMVFWKFAVFDMLACAMTTALLFFLGYSFGLNYADLLLQLNQWKIYIFAGAIFIALLVGLIYSWRKKRIGSAK